MPNPEPITRRIFLQKASLGTAAIACSSLLNPVAFGAGPSRDFSFVVVSDLHFRDERCKPWFDRVVAHLDALCPRPAFVMLAGDLSENGDCAQLSAIRKSFDRLPMQVRAVIGNHDHGPGGSREAYEAKFGTRKNHRFDVNGVQFLALDTTEGGKVYRTKISNETMDWVRATETLLSPEQTLVILTHFPMGRNWLRPLNATRMLRLLERQQLVASLSGHWHGQTLREAKGAKLTTSRCCSWWRTNHDGSPLKGYTLCRFVRDSERRGFAMEEQFQPVS